MIMYENRIKIGKNVKIGEGAVLGNLPLIINRETGERVRPEIKGGIRIEDNVDIASLCTISFGETTDTTLRKNVMVGALSSIGHDADIGENTILGPHVCVLGCVQIGKWCYIASQTVIKPYVKIGDYTMIGMGSVVNKNIPSGVVAYGTPCKVIRENTWRPKIE